MEYTGIIELKNEADLKRIMNFIEERMYFEKEVSLTMTAMIGNHKFNLFISDIKPDEKPSEKILVSKAEYEKLLNTQQEYSQMLKDRFEASDRALQSLKILSAIRPASYDFNDSIRQAGLDTCCGFKNIT